MNTRRTLRSQRDHARDQRDRAYEQLEDALESADTGRFTTKRLAHQLTEARDQVDALTRKLNDDRPTPAAELRDARRALMLSERARASLDAQLATVQAANEALCRAAVDRAGTLARPEATR